MFFWREHKDEDYAYKKAYRNWFLRESQGLIGDASPKYIFEKQVLLKIKQRCPSSLVIILVREPAERAHSNFYQKSGLRKNYEFNFYVKEFLYSGKDKAHRNFIFQRSLYEEYLPMVFNIFPEAILIRSEDLFVNPQEYLDRIFTRLRLASFECNLKDAKINQTKRCDGAITKETLKMLNDFYINTHAYMYKNFGIHWTPYGEGNE